MFVVGEGRLAVAFTARETGELFEGELRDGVPLVGETHVFSSGPRIATITAATEATLYEVPNSAMQNAAAAAPELVAVIGEVTTSRLRALRLYVALQKLLPEMDEPTLQAIQSRLEWIYLQPGERLFSRGDPSDGVYIALSGALAVVDADGPEARVLNTIAPGELIGEIGYFTGEPRSASVHAARDCELIRASRASFGDLLEKYPPFMRFVVQTLIRRVKANERPRVHAAGSRYTARRRAGQSAHVSVPAGQVRTVAIVPIGDVPLGAAVERLVKALSARGRVLALDGARLEALLGIRGISQIPPDHAYTTYLTSSLDQMEAASRFVVYVADREPSGWTRWCLRRSARVLLTAGAGGSPEPSPAEERMFGAERPFITPRETLVLLHGGGLETTQVRTGRWLERRDVDDHLHVSLDRDADFARLARSLTGETVGLVLSGGGARGCAHIGVVRALLESGVPIDAVGGTSIGAMVGALVAKGLPPDEILEIHRQIWIANRPLRKFTLPLVSLLSERRIDPLYERFYGDVRIEDLAIPFFCVSSNLTKTRAVVHRDGPVWRAVRASSAIPGIMVPSIEDGSLLVDGAMTNNLPADVMRDLGAGVNIVVNVGPGAGAAPRGERYPSPFELLVDRLLGRPKSERAAGIVEILARSALLSSAAGAQTAREASDLYLQPPVQRFGLLDFGALDEIAEAGYHHAKEELAKTALPL
jgi:predicted acylesterase/phospholipase RssA/CRP-like cAMP-binding protein